MASQAIGTELCVLDEVGERPFPSYSVEKLEVARVRQANRAYEVAALRSASRGTNRDRNRAREPLRGSEGDRCDARDFRPAV